MIKNIGIVWKIFLSTMNIYLSFLASCMLAGKFKKLKCCNLKRLTLIIVFLKRKGCGSSQIFFLQLPTFQNCFQLLLSKWFCYQKFIHCHSKIFFALCILLLLAASSHMLPSLLLLLTLSFYFRVLFFYSNSLTLPASAFNPLQQIVLFCCFHCLYQLVWSLNTQ